MLQKPMMLGDPEPNKIVICLPGRGGNGFSLANDYQNHADVNGIGYLAVTPKGYAWYPPPNGPGDSEAAIKGLPLAVSAIDELIDEIESQYDVPRSRIVLSGFSAGAVVALRTAMLSEEKLGGCIAHSGAILDTDSVPSCNKPSMPFLLTHAKDDSVFTYKQRFEPMLKAMKEKRWLVKTDESDVGGHQITVKNFEVTRKFLENL